MKKSAVFAGAMLVALGASQSNVHAQGEIPAKYATVVKEVPTSSAQRAREIFSELAKDGAGVVKDLTPLLTGKASDTDTTARLIMAGLVWYSEPAQRPAVAKAVAEAVGQENEPEPKDFLIEQLQYLNDPSVADALYPLINDSKAGQRAIRTLLELNPEGLADKIVAGINDQNSTPIQTQLLQAVTLLSPKSAAAVDKAIAASRSTDPGVNDAAIDALASIGDPKGIEAVLAPFQKKSLGNEGSFVRGFMDPGPATTLARRLNENGHKEDALRVLNQLLATEVTTGTGHVIISALTTLTDISPEAAVDQLAKFISVDQEDVREGALRNLNALKSPEVTAMLTKALEAAPDPEVSAAILLSLGKRGDKTALEAVSKQLASESADVRLAAVAASGMIDRAAAFPALASALAGADADLIKAISVQLHSSKEEDLPQKVAKTLPSVSPEARTMLIELLADRRASSVKDVVFENTADASPLVRGAAYKALERVATPDDLPRLRDMVLKAEKTADRNAGRKALVAVAQESKQAPTAVKLLMENYETGSVEQKSVILDSLAALADPAGLQLLVKEAHTSGTEVQEAAVRALGEWQSPEAVPELLKVAAQPTDPRHQVLAVRGVVRLAGEAEKPELKLQTLQQVTRFAKRPDEQKAIIAALAEVKTTAALRMLVPYLSNEATKAEAADAAAKIALPDGRYKGLDSAEAGDILRLAIDSISNADLRKKLEKHINTIDRNISMTELPADGQGWIALFNGKNLDGWAGNTEGYAAENGSLVCLAEGGGNLLTEKQFGDFTLKFEFKLPAGGNNGVGLRAPLTGDVAYHGMEVQILDDKDPKYKDIKDWQRHGSVYGLLPAADSEVKTNGEWNTQEITVKGPHVTVTVNGKKIVDGNLNEATSTGTLSGKEHPGAKRTSGHVGFLGHGSRVEFRNILLKPEQNQAPEGFTSVFDGTTLAGWKGLVANPLKRAAMAPEKLAEEQKKADDEMRAHWYVRENQLFFDGDGSHLCTTKDYKNFEMVVDWRLGPGGDSGIYLRGTPQVQIWDPHYWPQGSGGLYNNQKNTSDPLVLADAPIGQWNNFKIKMVDDKVTVHLNDKLVVDNVPLENYWDRKQPIFPSGQIELQSHGSPAWFRNLYVRELP